MNPQTQRKNKNYLIATFVAISTAISLGLLLLNRRVIIISRQHVQAVDANNPSQSPQVLHVTIDQIEKENILVTTSPQSSDPPSSINFHLPTDVQINTIKHEAALDSSNFPAFSKFRTVDSIQPGDQATIEVLGNQIRSITIDASPSMVSGEVKHISDREIIIYGKYNDPNYMPSSFTPSSESKSSEYMFTFKDDSIIRISPDKTAKIRVGDYAIVYSDQNIIKESNLIAQLIVPLVNHPTKFK